VKLIEWYPSCSSPAFGVSSQEFKSSSSICSEYPIGISYKGIQHYHTKGTYANRLGTTYIVVVDRKQDHKITIKSIDKDNITCDVYGDLEKNVEDYLVQF